MVAAACATETSRRFSCTAAVLALLACLAPLTASAGPAVNQFEVKNLDNEPGSIEFQSQNAHIFGQPRRKVLEPQPGDLAFDDNSLVRQRHALEMEMTVTTFLRLRVGIEYESERFDDPEILARANSFSALSLTEVALEGVVILVPVKGDGIGIGALAEYQAPIGDSDEAATLFAGPIVEAQIGRWNAVANLMLVRHIGGGERTPMGREGRDEKLDFAYAAHLQYKVSDAWTLSLEAYGTIDRLGRTGRRSDAAALFGDHDQHRLGPVVYYTFKADGLDLRSAGAGAAARKVGAGDADDGDNDEGTSVRVGVGWLFGLNENTPDHALKWSIEIDF